MTLHQLKVSVTVAKLQSFTLAGEKLHISQPSLSSIVAALARELGSKLFKKIGNKIRLTTVGERLLPRFEEILSKVEGTKEEVEEILGLKKAKLLVGATSLAAASFLPLAMQAYKKVIPMLSCSENRPDRCLTKEAVRRRSRSCDCGSRLQIGPPRNGTVS